MATALMDDAITGGEAQPAAAIFCCKKGLKQMCPDFVVHADASVGNADHNVFSGNEIAAEEGRFTLVAKIDNRCFKRELTAIRHGVTRVKRQVQEDLNQLTRIHLNVSALLWIAQMENDANAFADQTEDRPLEIRNERITFDYA